MPVPASGRVRPPMRRPDCDVSLRFGHFAAKLLG